MTMHDLGHTYPSPMSAEVEKETETRKDYPTIYIRGDQIPKMPEGKFYALVEMRVAGFRNPSEGEKSADIEVLSMSNPVKPGMAKKAMAMCCGEDESEDMDDDDRFSGQESMNAFRETMKEIMGKSQIGQSG